MFLVTVCGRRRFKLHDGSVNRKRVRIASARFLSDSQHYSGRTSRIHASGSLEETTFPISPAGRIDFHFFGGLFFVVAGLQLEQLDEPRLRSSLVSLRGTPSDC